MSLDWETQLKNFKEGGEFTMNDRHLLLTYNFPHTMIKKIDEMFNKWTEPNINEE